MQCLFCQIAEGSVPSTKVYEDSEIVAFKDINPQAPTHLLVIPRKHIPSLAEVTQEDEPILGRMMTVIRKLAFEHELAASGFRVVVNCGQDAGQAVHHLHYHLLGGRKLTWPPG